jgi:MHS family proline/betaine transporter-like MFS transporter
VISVAESIPLSAVRPRRALVGACLGNAVEWYDFATYGAFSTILARTFFPTGGRAALAATFAIFATSFIARPVGAMVVGRRSDRLGRRPALSRMIAMMTAATAAIGLLPTWSAIGVLAPVSLLLLRVAQGFSVGGEVPSSVAFLVESAPEGQRGWYGGWHTASIALGLAGGYGIAALLSATLSDNALRGWGWRVAFLLAAPLGLVARYIRRQLDETRMFEAVLAPATPRLLGDVLRGRGAGVSRGLVLVAALALAFNVWFVFLPSHLAASGTVPLGQALGIGVLGLFAAVGTAPVMGRLSDRIGRRAVLIAGTVAMATFAVPGLALASGSVPGLLVSDVVMGVLIGTLAVTAFVAELFPTAVRATGVALTYGVATAVFGGTAPLVATLLAVAEAAWVIPAYLAVVAVLALAAAVTSEETAFTKLR